FVDTCFYLAQANRALGNKALTEPYVSIFNHSIMRLFMSVENLQSIVIVRAPKLMLLSADMEFELLMSIPVDALSLISPSPIPFNCISVPLIIGRGKSIL